MGVEPCGCAAVLAPEGWDAFPAVLVDWVMKRDSVS